MIAPVARPTPNPPQPQPQPQRASAGLGSDGTAAIPRLAAVSKADSVFLMTPPRFVSTTFRIPDDGNGLIKSTIEAITRFPSSVVAAKGLVALPRWPQSVLAPMRLRPQ